MIDYKELSLKKTPDFPKLKVVHKKSGHLQVFFPFSEVPVEMTKKYFDRNIREEQYIIDFTEDFDQTKAG